MLNSRRTFTVSSRQPQDDVTGRLGFCRFGVQEKKAWPVLDLGVCPFGCAHTFHPHKITRVVPTPLFLSAGNLIVCRTFPLPTISPLTVSHIHTLSALSQNFTLSPSPLSQRKSSLRFCRIRDKIPGRGSRVESIPKV